MFAGGGAKIIVTLLVRLLALGFLLVFYSNYSLEMHRLTADRVREGGNAIGRVCPHVSRPCNFF